MLISKRQHSMCLGRMGSYTACTILRSVEVRSLGVILCEAQLEKCSELGDLRQDGVSAMSVYSLHECYSHSKIGQQCV